MMGLSGAEAGTLCPEGTVGVELRQVSTACIAAGYHVIRVASLISDCAHQRAESWVGAVHTRDRWHGLLSGRGWKPSSFIRRIMLVAGVRWQAVMGVVSRCSSAVCTVYFGPGLILWRAVVGINQPARSLPRRSAARIGLGICAACSPCLLGA